MRRQFLSATMAVLLSGIAGLAQLIAQTPKEIRKAESVKAKVARLGTGPRVRVIVKLEGGETIKGYVSSIAEDSFVVERPADRGPRQVSYRMVKEVNKKPSTGRIMAGIGLVAATTVGLLYLSAYLLSKCSPCIGP